jgi:hypothetical protein
MRAFKTALFLTAVLFLTALLNAGLVPDNIARADIGRVSTGTYDDLFLGTSHGFSDINPETVDALTGRKSTNACMPEEFPIDSYYILSLAIAGGHKPSRVIYELDSQYWTQDQPEQSNDSYIYRSFPAGTVKLRYFKDKIMMMDWRVTFAPWHFYTDNFKKFPEILRARFSTAYRNRDLTPLNTKTQTFHPNGYVEQVLPDPQDRKEKEIPYTFSEGAVRGKALRYFEGIVRLCRENGIALTVIKTPTPKETRTRYAEAFTAADTYFSALCGRAGIAYHNFDREADAAMDTSLLHMDYEGHMDRTAAEAFSTLLGKYLLETDTEKP